MKFRILILPMLLPKKCSCVSFFLPSVGSSNSSHSNPRDQSHRDERLETHLEAEQSEDEDEFIDNDFKGMCYALLMLLSGILAKVNKPNNYILISHKHKLIP